MAFENNTERYDNWFVRHEKAYLSELNAIRQLLPDHSYAVEIGVGTGRFAEELDVQIGIDPSRSMLREASARGVHVIAGVAEALPIRDGVFDSCLVVTTICFVDDAAVMLDEAYRILRPGGLLIVGLIDRVSTIGKEYVAHQSESVFYREATFFSIGEVNALLTDAGFGDLKWVQTLFEPPSQAEAVEPCRPGFGEGSFVVVSARRASSPSLPDTRVLVT
jgi:SAM-dependent methyltransferase